MCNVIAVQVTESFKYLPHEPGRILLLQPFFSIKNRLQFTTCSSTSEQRKHLMKQHVTTEVLVSHSAHSTPKTPDGFWSLKTNVLAKRRLHNCRHHEQRCLELMKRWSMQVSSAEVELFTKAVTATVRGFRQLFQRHDVPSRNTLLLWISKLR